MDIMKINDCDELVISYLFPPSDDVSGITVLKRIIEQGKKVDVLHTNSSSVNNRPYIEKYINERLIVDIDCNYDWVNCIWEFVKKGMGIIKKDYKKIYSRSWLMSNHFLACEYKFSNPDVLWHAEFSDPLIFDLSNNIKNYNEMIINDNGYIKKINNQIINYNKKNHTDFNLIKDNTSAYFICEYLCYIFADKLTFTNVNQRDIMINQFPLDVKKHIIDKTEIKMHPTLSEEYYHLDEINLNLNNKYINVAYFGSDYYGKRHFESLFYAFESLNHKYKNRIQFHIYISDINLVENLITSDAFTICEPIDYFEFLNATTKFDILIVHDMLTRDSFEFNPYLPSKLSDYLGSNSDIWALYEKGSSLSNFDLKYKSDMTNFNECADVLAKILEDKGFNDENYTINGDYLFNRLTTLNELYEMEFRKKQKYKKEVNDILSSNSWKITKPLRNLRNKK